MATLAQDQFSAVFGNRRGVGFLPRPIDFSWQTRIAESLLMISDLVEETEDGITLILEEAFVEIEAGLVVDPKEPTIRVTSQDGIASYTTSVEDLLGEDGDAGTYSHILEIAANGEQYKTKIANSEHIQALDSASVARQVAWCLINRWHWLKGFLPVNL